MRPDPRLDSIVAWRYRMLADEVLAHARALEDPNKRRVFEDIAAAYLKLASSGSAQHVPA